MGTEILRPQNCLILRPPPAAIYRFSDSNVNNHNNRRCKKSTARYDRQEQRKRFVPTKRPSFDDLKAVKNGLAMENVTILRRGQSLDSIADNRAVFGSAPIRIAGKADVYAGSAFFMSPSPSSLPLPSFSKKKQVSIIIDDSATRDLRRLLRIDA